MKFKVFCLIAALSMAGHAIAQNIGTSTARDKERLQQLADSRRGPAVSYKWNDKDVALRQNMRKVVIELSDYNRGVALRANRALRGLSSVRMPAKPSRDYARSRFIMEWKDGEASSTATWRSRAAELRSNASVKAVWPSYVYPPTGIDIYCAGEVTVRANGSTVTALSVAAQNGLELVDDGPRVDPQTLTFRMRSPEAGDPFTLAEKLSADTKVFAYATPNLTQNYRMYSNWVPWEGLSPMEAFSGSDTLRGQQTYLSQANFINLFSKLKYMAWPELYDNNYPLHFTRIPTVAIVDTGFDYTHPDIIQNSWKSWNEWHDDADLEDRIDNDYNLFVDDLYGWDFFANDNKPTSTLPHGTAVAGVAAGRGFNEQGICGASPYLCPMPIKIAEADANGNTVFAPDATIQKAIIYAGMMCDVVNLSWSGGAPTPLIDQAIMHCMTYGRMGYRVNQFSQYVPSNRGAGTPVFVAAGNEGTNKISFPAAYPWAVAIGAVNEKGIRNAYSNVGQQLDLMAPVPTTGSITTDISGADGYTANDYYDGFTGTSAAAPLAAGLALDSMSWQRRKFPDGYVYSARQFDDHEHRFELPGDNYGLRTDPRFYSAGEVIIGMIQGASKVSSSHALYDKSGFSWQYGWGRLDALKMFENLPKDVDDYWEEDMKDQKDPSTVSNLKYLRPGFHKWLIARDYDCFLIPMEAGSSAKITVSYLRDVQGRTNLLKGADLAKYGNIADEGTSPRLKVEFYPYLDPYMGPPTHKSGEFLAGGWPAHPLYSRQIATGLRFQDRIETKIFYETFKTLNADGTVNWDLSAPDRPYKDQDTSYYMSVIPQKMYFDSVNMGASWRYRTYTPVVEYCVDFEYYPAPRPRRATADGAGTLYYGDDEPQFFQHGNYRNWELDKPGGFFGFLPAGTTLKSVSYPFERQYGYPAMTEPFHPLPGEGRAPVNIYVFPAAYRENLNCMLTYDLAQSDYRMQIYDDFDLTANVSDHPGLPAETIWDHLPARQDTYFLGAGDWKGPGHQNNYYMGVHYSFVKLDANNKPIEFTTDAKGNLSLGYYPFEHLNAANNYEKKYLLKTNDFEGARVTAAQQMTTTMPLGYSVWLTAFDKLGLPVAKSATSESAQSVVMAPTDVGTTYSIVAQLVATSVTAESVPPEDVRFMLAVDRSFIPGEYPPPVPMHGKPDLIISDAFCTSTLGRNLTNTIYGDKSTTVEISVRNIGTDLATTFLLAAWTDDKLTSHYKAVLPSPMRVGDIRTTSIGVTSLTVPVGGVYPSSATKILRMWADAGPELDMMGEDDQKISELQERNNYKELVIRWFPAGADLILGPNYTVSPQNPDGTSNLNVGGLLIHNAGSVDYQSSWRISITDENGRQIGLSPPLNYPLISGQNFTLPPNIQIQTAPLLGEPGPRKIFATILPAGTDVDVSNNKLAIPVILKANGARDWKAYR